MRLSRTSTLDPLDHTKEVEEKVEILAGSTHENLRDLTPTLDKNLESRVFYINRHLTDTGQCKFRGSLGRKKRLLGAIGVGWRNCQE